MVLKTQPDKIISVNYGSELRSDVLYFRQWIICRNIPISRRDWPDEMSLAFVRCYDTVFQFKNGVIYELPYIDDIFTDAEDMRWWSLYLESDDSGLTPQRMSTKIERLRLINLFLKVRYPRLGKHLEL